MKWLRLYHEARNDAKLRSLSNDQFRVWFNLLCFAAEQADARGSICGYDTELLAVEVADGDVELLNETIERLQRLRVITVNDDGCIHFVNFEKRQYDKPSDTPERVAERVRRHRERQRNADVTPSNAAVTPRNDTEAEADTESELATSAASRPRAPEAVLFVSTTEREVVEAIQAVPGMAEVPVDAILAHYRSFPTVQKLSADDQVFEAIKFRDFWTDKRKRDRKPFRNWKNSMSNWYQRASPARASPRRAKNQPDYSGIDEWAETMDELEQRRAANDL